MDEALEKKSNISKLWTFSLLKELSLYKFYIFSIYSDGELQWYNHRLIRKMIFFLIGFLFFSFFPAQYLRKVKGLREKGGKKPLLSGCGTKEKENLPFLADVASSIIATAAAVLPCRRTPAGCPSAAGSASAAASSASAPLPGEVDPSLSATNCGRWPVVLHL
jgi:hypothetical protein